MLCFVGGCVPARKGFRFVEGFCFLFLTLPKRPSINVQDLLVRVRSVPELGSSSSASRFSLTHFSCNSQKRLTTWMRGHVCMCNFLCSGKAGTRITCQRAQRGLLCPRGFLCSKANQAAYGYSASRCRTFDVRAGNSHVLISHRSETRNSYPQAYNPSRENSKVWATCSGFQLVSEPDLSHKKYMKVSRMGPPELSSTPRCPGF